MNAHFSMAAGICKQHGFRRNEGALRRAAGHSGADDFAAALAFPGGTDVVNGHFAMVASVGEQRGFGRDEDPGGA